MNLTIFQKIAVCPENNVGDHIAQDINSLSISFPFQGRELIHGIQFLENSKEPLNTDIYYAIVNCFIGYVENVWPVFFGYYYDLGNETLYRYIREFKYHNIDISNINTALNRPEDSGEIQFLLKQFKEDMLG